MQIAGSMCEQCKGEVVFAEDGKGCAQCGVVVHEKCEAQDSCPRCGGTYERFEQPPRDIVQDAIVPRSLRAVRPDSSVALVIIGLVFFLLMFLIWLYIGRAPGIRLTE